MDFAYIIRASALMGKLRTLASITTLWTHITGVEMVLREESQCKHQVPLVLVSFCGQGLSNSLSQTSSRIPVSSQPVNESQITFAEFTGCKLMQVDGECKWWPSAPWNFRNWTRSNLSEKLFKEHPKKRFSEIAKQTLICLNPFHLGQLAPELAPQLASFKLKWSPELWNAKLESTHWKLWKPNSCSSCRRKYAAHPVEG